MALRDVDPDVAALFGVDPDVAAHFIDPDVASHFTPSSNINLTDNSAAVQDPNNLTLPSPENYQPTNYLRPSLSDIPMAGLKVIGETIPALVRGTVRTISNTLAGGARALGEFVRADQIDSSEETYNKLSPMARAQYGSYENWARSAENTQELSQNIGAATVKGADAINAIGQRVEKIAPHMDSRLDNPEEVAKIQNLPIWHPDRVALNLTNGVESLPALAKTMAATVFVGPLAGVTVTGLESFDSSTNYAKQVLSQNPDLTPAQRDEMSLKYGITSAAIDSAFTQFGVDRLMSVAKLGEGAMKNFLVNAGLNLASNNVAVLTKKLVEKGTINPDLTSKDIANEVVNATIAGVLPSMLGYKYGQMAGASKKGVIEHMLINQDDVSAPLKMLPNETPSDYTKRLAPYSFTELQKEAPSFIPFDAIKHIRKIERQAGEDNGPAAVASYFQHQNVNSAINKALAADTGYTIEHNPNGQSFLKNDPNGYSVKRVIDTAGGEKDGIPVLQQVVIDRMLRGHDAKRNEVTAAATNIKDEITDLKTRIDLAENHLANTADPRNAENVILQKELLQKRLVQAEKESIDIDKRIKSDTYDFGPQIEGELRGAIKGRKIDPVVRLRTENAVNKFLDQIADTLVESGEISIETKDAWKADQLNYSSLQRNMQSDQAGQKTGIGGMLMKREGSDVGGLKSANQWMQELQQRALRSYFYNRARKDIVARISEHDPDGVSSPQVKPIDEKDGGVKVMMGGKEMYYKVADKQLRQIFTDMDVAQLDDKVLKPMQIYAGIQQKMMTTHPVFLANSSVRNIYEAIMQRPEWTNFPLTGFRAVKAMRDKSFTDLLERNGGTFENMRSASGIKGTDQWYKDNIVEKGVYGKVMDTYKGLAAAGENFTRVGTAADIYRRTGDINRAVEGSLETGPNYPNKGNNQYVSAGLKTVTFGPAQTQGLVTWLNNVKRNPKSYAMKAAGLASISAMYRVLENEGYVGEKDEDGNIKFRNQTEGSAFAGPLVKLPALDKYVRVPEPYVEKIFRLIPQLAVDTAYGDKLPDEEGRTFFRWLDSNGIGLPATIDIPQQLAANRNKFFNTPIVPESLANGPKSLQVGPSSSLNAVGAATDTSGAQLDFLARNTFGSQWTNTVLALTDTVTDWADDRLSAGGNFESALGQAAVKIAFKTPSERDKYQQAYYDFRKMINDEVALSMAEDPTHVITVHQMERAQTFKDLQDQYKLFGKEIDKNNTAIKDLRKNGIPEDDDSIVQMKRINNSIGQAAVKLAIARLRSGGTE